MEKKVLNTIKKYNLIKNNERIVLAVSGGPDSMCMLDILNKIRNASKIKFDFVVAHLNHLIRKESTQDEQYVENYCKKNKIKCFIKRIDVKKYANNKKIGTEESGRILRYEFFEEILKKEQANKIAIAHNKNDRAETVIMKIIRGTGISRIKRN